ncbi:MAG: transglycosylase SLT domain-containing protein [Methylococcales bacterium]|nr:transglycosylase SLT domain-containing protein [Methylococcales bacterium]
MRFNIVSVCLLFFVLSTQTVVAAKYTLENRRNELFSIIEVETPEPVTVEEVKPVEVKTQQVKKTLPPVLEYVVEDQRKLFFLAERLIRKKNHALFFKLSERLKDYPLHPYLQYQWLKVNLNQNKKVKAFLTNFPNTRYAGLLNFKWLMYLAKYKKWPMFLKQYSSTSNIKLQCFYYQAKYNTGARNEALVGAKKLWKTGESLPSECNAIFKALTKSPLFTQDLLWHRLGAALKNKKIPLARYVKRLMNNKNQDIATFWLQTHSNPLLIEKQTLLDKTKSQAGSIFAHGVDRMASKNLTKAISLWDARKNDFEIDSNKLGSIEKRLAMALAFRRNEGAYSRLSQIKKPDKTIQEWRVRAALRMQNWAYVEQAILDLTEDIKKKDKWQYWLARSLENTNKPKIANFIFSHLSKDRSFYGYLSADKLKKTYQLSDRPVQVTDEMMTQLKQKTDFRVVTELIEVNKRQEARRQWWYAVKKLTDKDIIIAAKYAEQLKWKQVAIFTIAKAKYWDDVSLRFPMAYEQQVHKNAQVQKLDSAVIFGLIRRESAFNQYAHSPVGAKGLMQIMPKTGRQIARELKERWRGKNNLFNPEVNLKYGSYYYKQLLNQFDGHYALAAAAYNAGPHRVKKWLPEENAMAADIWVETIPYKETRAYVSAVLTYALIYQKKLKKNLLSMKDFMKDVAPD